MLKLIHAMQYEIKESFDLEPENTYPLLHHSSYKPILSICGKCHS